MRQKLRFAPRGLLILACAIVPTVAVLGAAADTSIATDKTLAKTARTVTLSETAHLEPTKREVPGAELSESGRALGTYDAPVLAGLTIHAHSVTSIVTVFLKSGSITATADASFKFSGEVGNFHGTLNVSRATGTYRHASGQLAFRGAINRNTLKMWAVTSGSAKY